MVRNSVRGTVTAVLAAVSVAVTGCTSSAQDDGGKAAPKPRAAAESAMKGGSVGGSGSACALPVTFDLAASWKPEAVQVIEDDALSDLGKQGPVTLVCEIDAKPAGNIGFLRVWTGDRTDDTPRQVLKAFLAADPNAAEATYTDVKAGSLTAAEVGYTVSSELLDEPKKERAFAVPTPSGPVVVHLGGLDSQEHEEMLPAYELAKKSVRLG
ncbi:MULTISPECIES: lipoprotein [unclassified Streptomyces]|uniref:lipoprotein n=1 Tax=unclassified Streptomyces TaxID=2593676 RepID=UPI002DDBCB17|nr:MULTISPECIES: lipoprotein [unclassified Streptomyces]WSC45595.1 lipoprotein [Streptomyces sp. NBC_01762]WSD25258.1 lipoprotein [Streptomyces sp. NBC_01751]